MKPSPKKVIIRTIENRVTIFCPYCETQIYQEKIEPDYDNILQASIELQWHFGNCALVPKELDLPIEKIPDNIFKKRSNR